MVTVNEFGNLHQLHLALAAMIDKQHPGKEPVTLMTFVGKDGDFADEDISVIEAGKPTYCIKQSDGKLELRAKSSGFMFVVW